jgi:PPOX class probable F420-dependent enzyme
MGILPDSGRAAERLDREAVGWLTTVTGSGRPQSSVVWFAVSDETIYVRSQPGAAKVANIRANDKVSFHLDGNSEGGDIVTIDGDAEIVDVPPPGLLDAYVAKYERRIRESLQTTPDEMLADYNTTVRITPKRVRAW